MTAMIQSFVLLLLAILVLCNYHSFFSEAAKVDDNDHEKKKKNLQKGEDKKQQQPQQKKKPPPPSKKGTADDNNNKRLDLKRLAPFDTDIRDDCFSMLSHCQSEIFAHAFLQCPKSCTELLDVSEANMKGTASDDENNADGLWDDDKCPTLRTYQGKTIATERFEGTVTVVCVLPLLPGMAVYYYEMMEYLHSAFKPNVEFVIIPIDHNEGIHIQVRSNSKVLVLEEESAIQTHPWIQHLTSIKPRSGGGEQNHRGEITQVELHTDRVTFYVVSADGYYIERLVSPMMATLKERIILYQKTIDYEL